MKTLLTASLLLPLAFAAPALAHPPGAGHEGRARMMERYDTNKDGAIDQVEFRAARDAMFARLDPNGDGRIAKADFATAVETARKARHAERMDRMFDRLDADKDGFVTKEEYLAGADAMFARMDRDGDGKLVPGEGRGEGRSKRGAANEGAAKEGAGDAAK